MVTNSKRLRYLKELLNLKNAIDKPVLIIHITFHGYQFEKKDFHLLSDLLESRINFHMAKLQRL